MIAVIDVKIVKPPNPALKIHSRRELGFAEWANHSERTTYAPIDIETIEGERFCVEGRDVVIGMSHAVQEAIGLPMKLFRDMHLEVECTRRENGRLASTCFAWEQKFSELQGATFWDRLVWLFKGVK